LFDGEILVLGHMKEEAEEVGDTVSAASAEDCQDLKIAMDSAFWDRVSVLVKKEDNTDIYAHPDLGGSIITRGETSPSTFPRYQRTGSRPR
jgi:hypothetical protein